MVKCPRCGTNNAPNNASCIACGAGLAAGPPPGAPYGGGGYPPPGYPGAGGPPPGGPGGFAPPGGPPPVGAPPGMPPGGYPGGYPGAPPGAPGGFPPPHQTGPGAFGPPPGMAQAQPPGMAPGPAQPPPVGMPPGSGMAGGSPMAGAAPMAAAGGAKIAGFLLTYDVETRGSFWPLRVGDNRVGRKGADAALDVAVDHPTVSSNHALIHVEAQGGVAQIEDQRSANGTFLHDKTIAGQGRREIRDGDRIRLGAVNVVVKLVDPG